MLTEDSDLLVFGASPVYYKLDENGATIRVALEDVSELTVSVGKKITSLKVDGLHLVFPVLLVPCL